MEIKTIKTNPLISVCVITYNHEKYIAETIEAILQQKTKDSYEIIIGEDKSTDNTKNICENYKKKNPSIIKLLKNKSNLGLVKNWVKTIQNCNGKYIAFCDGDDYWIDPSKLQKQVDFLEANPEYGMVCTNYHKYYQKDKKLVKNVLSKNINEIFYDEFLLDRSTIATSTIVVLRDLFIKYQENIGLNKIYEWDVEDTPLLLFILRFSKIKVLNESTAVYRILDNSACNFTDLHKHYEFVKKGYKIPHFFIRKYGCSEITKKKLFINFHRITLNYGFNTRNQKIAKESYYILKKNTLININDFLRYVGSYNIILNKLAKFCIGKKKAIKIRCVRKNNS